MKSLIVESCMAGSLHNRDTMYSVERIPVAIPAGKSACRSHPAIDFACRRRKPRAARTSPHSVETGSTDLHNRCIEAITRALTGGCVLTEGIPPRNLTDMSGLAATAPAALVLPADTEGVSHMLRICQAEGQRVVVQGGMTGLVGGAVPRPDEVALSLERLVGVEEIDLAAGTLTALAGTPLAVVQQAAQDAGLFYGVDLGARGSCTIGGTVATNAGGNQVLRYGMTRRNIRGLEAVLADGRILHAPGKMLKNNTGYDWTQLLIGSEGTLGVITRVTVALQPAPGDIASALVAVASAEDAITVLRRLEARLPAGLVAFEAMWHEFHDLAVGELGLAAPLPPGHDLYLLVEAPQADASGALADALAELHTGGLVADAVLARSGADRNAFWSLRESVYEHFRIFGTVITFDISIPPDRIGPAVAALRVEIPAAFPGVPWVVFGHLADSNIHVNVMPGAAAEARRAEAEAVVYGITRRFEGSVSAEHGIGRTKRANLGISRTAEELSVMAAIKRAFDPKGILNPGRILPEAAAAG